MAHKRGTVHKIKGGYRAYSQNWGKPLGPKRPTQSAARKDINKSKGK